ncbi:hypothetical protein SAM_0266 [Streptococcus agalactiae CJB111]|nr:hypothetical protein SAM_0266 [Streptococcus agalactiae CJB111]
MLALANNINKLTAPKVKVGETYQYQISPTLNFMA